ncbi:MAG: hypothetical protein QY314_02445 [Candidatus Dojkabacteria bacterium]|nr:MAG: hypothetical protein QY314_02445 [Candidatus Dojkabacteria bacterium]
MTLQEILQSKGNFSGDIETILPLFLSKVEQQDYNAALEVLTAFPAHGKILLWKDSKAAEVMLLLDLLCDESDKPLVSEGKSGDFYVLYGLALKDKGQLQKAITYLGRALEVFKGVKPLEYVETVCDIISPLRIAGELEKAQQLAEEAYSAAEAITPAETSAYWQNIVLRLLGHIETLSGNFTQAEEHLTKTLSFWQDYSKKVDYQPEGMIHAFLARLYIERTDMDTHTAVEKAAHHADRALALADNQKFGRDYVRGIILQSAVALKQDHLTLAKKLSDNALERAHSLGIAEQMGDALYLSAQIALAQHDTVTAKGLISEIMQEQTLAEHAHLQKKASELLQIIQ